jgi:hypothetical protein
VKRWINFEASKYAAAGVLVEYVHGMTPTFEFKNSAGELVRPLFVPRVAKRPPSRATPCVACLCL